MRSRSKAAEGASGTGNPSPGEGGNLKFCTGFFRDGKALSKGLGPIEGGAMEPPGPRGH